MEHKDTVRKFVDALGKMKPATISASLLKSFITNIIIDSESLEEFIAYSDSFLKHSQTFQMAFLLHSLSSILTIDPLGNPIKQTRDNIETHAFNDISMEEIQVIIKSDEAKRYEGLCDKLMDLNGPEAKSLEKRMFDQRHSDLEKIDDGTEPNQLFDPMKSKFPTQTEPGEDLTEELEVMD